MALYAWIVGVALAAGTLADLTVEVTGAKSDVGAVAVTLYNDAAGFPTDPQKAFRVAWSPVRERQAKVTFSELTPGTYAVAVFHDLNGNQKLDTNFIGIPNEPVAASRQAVGKMGPPKFVDAAIVLGKGATRVVIKLPD